MISSPSNPRVKELTRMRRASHRREADVVLVEGRDEIALALESGARPADVFHCPALTGDAGGDLLRRATERGAAVHQVTEQVFRKISYRDGPDGWLATVARFETRLDALSLPERPIVVVCSALEKPGNLGAILRTADAAGVDAVISTDSVTDWANPNVVRASRATVFSVPVADAPPEQLVPWLRDRGVRILATTPDGGTPHTEVDMAGPVAIVVGGERHGLGAEWLTAADARVRIAMYGRVNSLNVATSAALLMYEARRQRGLAG